MAGILFTEGKIGVLTAKNRLVRSATNDHLGNLDGTLSEEQFSLYEELAKSGVGTIITGHFGVDEYYKADENQPLADDDKFLPGMEKMAALVHQHGALLYGQISQGGLKGYYHTFDINQASKEALALTAQKFGEAALRLEKAGFDGVQVHLAHGYFLANVLDNSVNLREDEYGGNDENRFRIVKEILNEIHRKCTSGFSVIVKLSAYNETLTAYDEHLLYYGHALEEAGAECIELSGTDFAHQPKTADSYYLQQALRLKDARSIPIILVGGLDRRERMENALAQGIDFVSCARAFICEPQFAARLQNGEEKSKCLHCYQCFKLPGSKFKNCVFLPESAQIRRIKTRG